MSRLSRLIIFENFFGKSAINGNCLSCNEIIHKTINTWHRSHIIPMSRGGPDIYMNILPLCAPCNINMRNEYLVKYLLRKNLIYQNNYWSLNEQIMHAIRSWDPICIGKIGEYRCNFRKYGVDRVSCNRHIKIESYYKNNFVSTQTILTAYVKNLIKL